MSLLKELKRRNVFRVATAYIVVSWLLIQVAETIFPLFELGDAPARIVVIVLAVGFIPALVVSWAFELTPDGLKKDSEVDRSGAASATTGKTLDRAIMLILALALGFFAFDKFVLSPARDVELAESAKREGRSEAIAESYGDHSIAVLPFADMSPDADHQYLSDGLAEEMLNLLAQVDELRVASRSSAFNLRNSELSIPEMAAKLGVAYILEGSVRLHGDQLRVTAQLIEAGSDTHVWSQNYDRKFENIFAIQDDISASVVEALKVEVLDQLPQAVEVDPAAYDLGLQASFLMNSLDPANAPRVVALYQQAVEIDPGYFSAWLGLGGIYQMQVTFGQLEREPGLEKAWAAIHMAESINPESRRVPLRKGWMAIRWDQDMAAARDHYQKAADLTEDPWQRVSGVGDYLRRTGRFDIKLPVDERRARENPTAPNARMGLALSYGGVGRYEDSIREARATLMLSPGIWQGNEVLANPLLMTGRYAEALEVAESIEREPSRLRFTAIALYMLGRHEESAAAVARLVELEGDFPEWWATFEVLKGDHDAAFRVLNASPVEDFRRLRVPWDPDLKSLHDDPRWPVFLERINASPEDIAEFELDLRLPDDWFSP